MANIEFPDLDNGTLVGGSIFATSQPRISDPSTYESKKVTAQDVGNFVASTQQYAGLDTTAKTLIGAINEAAQGGGSSTLAGLSDVWLQVLSSGDLLFYNGQSQKWQNYSKNSVSNFEYFDLQYDSVNDEYYLDVACDQLVVFGNMFNIVPFIGTTNLGDVGNPSVYMMSGTYLIGEDWHIVFSRIVMDNGVKKLQYMIGTDASSSFEDKTTFELYETEIHDTKEISGTLTAGATSITLSDAAIKSNSKLDVYTDPPIDYNSITPSVGSVTLTFDAQQSNVAIVVRVS